MFLFLYFLRIFSVFSLLPHLQTGIIRVANCNLHNQAVGEGISAVVQDVNIRQYIEQQHAEVTRLQPAGQGQGPGQPLGLGQPPLLRRSVWLEAGAVNLNLITADIALAADHPAKCEVQRQFLELHDAQTKRWKKISKHFVFQATILKKERKTFNLFFFISAFQQCGH